jgi:5-formyltetrahydrofolate cyclo-ligase
VTETKAQIRTRVWDALAETGAARFPFPPHGRIPNFAGARQAAERCLALPPLAAARRVKINPDAPQLPLRAAALEAGIAVYVPTPRLRGGFLELDPARIPAGERRRAASLSQMPRHARPVALDALPELDAIVAGSVAVSRLGHRCGKGEGYADLEYAVLRELGQRPVPVLTTVAELQIVASIPADPLDLPLAFIVTPDRTLEVASPPPPPPGLDWSRISDARIAEMPILAELRRRKDKGRHRT